MGRCGPWTGGGCEYGLVCESRKYEYGAGKREVCACQQQDMCWNEATLSCYYESEHSSASWENSLGIGGKTSMIIACAVGLVACCCFITCFIKSKFGQECIMRCAGAKGLPADAEPLDDDEVDELLAALQGEWRILPMSGQRNDTGVATQ